MNEFEKTLLTCLQNMSLKALREQAFLDDQKVRWGTEEINCPREDYLIGYHAAIYEVLGAVLNKRSIY